MPPSPPTTVLTLPSELITRIFTLSSNPALVLTCKELHRTLAPLSKSISTRIEFLLTRYRQNYIKAVVKGLRWSFFDQELLHSLDRIYARERARNTESLAKESLNSDAIDQLTHHNFGLLPSIDPTSDLTSISPSTTQKRVATSIDGSISAQDSIERPKKRRKKYQIQDVDKPSTTDQNGTPKDASDASSTSTVKYQSHQIPLPSNFALPRRLFKSKHHLELIKELLSRGGSPSQPSGYPLIRAAQRGDVEMVKVLLAHGAPPDQKALRWACVQEWNTILDVFLELGVRPDGTCLAWCVEKGKTAMVDRLLRLGVVPDLKTVLLL
ncbi:hypothetical protein BGZ94_008461 [Podila epigama]|nr:hypothetical protein BGZ94_008461 [Podila epigama]